MYSFVTDFYNTYLRNIHVYDRYTSAFYSKENYNTDCIVVSVLKFSSWCVLCIMYLLKNISIKKCMLTKYQVQWITVEIYQRWNNQLCHHHCVQIHLNNRCIWIKLKKDINKCTYFDQSRFLQLYCIKRSFVCCIYILRN